MNGIKVAKVGQRIGISSVWTLQTVILKSRASVLLEYLNSTDGEYRSVFYGVVKIRKLFVESSDFMEWIEGKETRSGRIRRRVASSLSFCFDDSIKNSN